MAAPDVSAPDVSAPDSTPDSSVCPTGNLLCGSMCVDVTDNHDNCGACGNACGDGTCQSGSCHCDWGRTFCRGGCIYLGSNSDCGSCGDRCSNACIFGNCI